MHWILIAILLFGILALVHWIWKRSQIQKWQNLPWPAQWEKVLQNRMPLYQKLTEPQKLRLQQLVQVFVRKKPFEGCAGLVVTEEMKVLIAAQACLLVVNRPVDAAKLYPKLDVILIYPSAYVTQGVKQQGWQVWTEQEQVRLGESWHQGIVVLSWDHVQGQARDVHDGHNVVLHEFAHQLDQEDGYSDGTPLLDQRSQYVSWGRHFGKVYQDLVKKVSQHRPSFLDAYGATNPAEFFAVATETFFEKPKSFQKHYPQLYQELANYYHLDPSEWLGSSSR